eukprot:TRINITY_DN21191_c0_g1_i1.p1 TRINITY_DN21191_c0_g1~~TRINITY_DN21191_c0_g1_i1.p1  ORF type:complete len:106 (-),score=16.81 TRINITY_DN21191_c0_g1_i1:91-408(-)
MNTGQPGTPLLSVWDHRAFRERERLFSSIRTNLQLSAMRKLGQQRAKQAQAHILEKRISSVTARRLAATEGSARAARRQRLNTAQARDRPPVLSLIHISEPTRPY